MKKLNEEFSVKDLIALFVPKIWIILIVSLVVSLFFGGYSAFVKDDTYTSSAKMHVIKLTSSQISASDIDYVSKVIDDYKILITTDSFLSRVMTKLNSMPAYTDSGWTVTKDFVRSHMTTSVLTDDILEISVTTTDAHKSHVIATAVSSVIQENSIELFAFGDTLNVRIVHASSVSPVANSKNVARNAVIGFAGGAVVSMLAIFVLSLFDIVVHDKKKLEESFDMPIIGLIPRFDIDEERK